MALILMLYSSEGAMIWYLKNTVRARVARETYGTDIRAVYDSVIHGARSHMVETTAEFVIIFIPVISLIARQRV